LVPLPWILAGVVGLAVLAAGRGPGRGPGQGSE
jgi:hypothetical protein